MNAQTKKCPMCAEQIPADAVLCPYCATRLVGETLPPPPVVIQPPIMPVQPLPAPKKKGVRWVIGGLTFGLCAILAVLVILASNSGLQLPAFIVSLTPTPTPTRTFTPTHTLDYTATQKVLDDQHATATAQAAQTVVFDASRWTQAIFDPFDWNKYGWGVGSYAGSCINGDQDLLNGRYVWNFTAKSGCVLRSYPNYRAVEDFYLAVDCQQISGAEDAACGVILRKLDDDHYYYFSVSTDQYVSMLAWQESEWISLLSQKSQAIQPWKVNRMIVIAQGSHFLFFVNGQYVAELVDEKIASGKVGLMIDLNYPDDTAVFEFDNFELRVP
jgi:hypothetical protein